jgi:molecular chaperone DnaJ
MDEDYYCVLGVDADASPEEIKSAYRKQAKRLHPDHAGGETGPFRAVQEAYEVLCDPARRESYDAARARARRVGRQGRAVVPEPLRQRPSPVEPLVPTRVAPGYRASGGPALLLEEMLQALWGEVGWSAGRAAAQTIPVRVTLTAEQACHGGRVRIWLPVQIACPACGGRGGMGFLECLECYGSGVVADETPVDIAFPAGVADGCVGRVPLVTQGRRPVELAVRFRVVDR